VNKLITAFCLAIISGVCVFAQTGEEYNRNEFFIGYSNQQVDRGEHTTFNGFEGSYVRNVNRYFGIKADVSGAYRNEDFQGTFQTAPGVTSTFRTETKNSIYNFLGGVQVKDNASEARLKPFGHALAGVAHVRAKIRGSGSSLPTQNFTFHDTGFAAGLVGGLDIKINDRFDLRAIQVDYNPIYTERRFENNFRFSIGLIIK